jgi:hypothetical protein
MLLAMAAGARAQAQVLAPQQEPFSTPPSGVPYYSRHSVFRPMLNIPTRKPAVESGFEFPTKPLFLKGYAGSNYGQGPREVFVPTGYGSGYIQPMSIGAPASAPCNRWRWLRR